MSSPEALAAVTKALQNLLSGELGGASVTTKPPSAARNGETGDQLNIFLYSVRHSPSFRNDPLPGTTKSGELAFPPLSLMLKYLITAYGKGDDDIYGQALLGKAMSILHDHPLLNRSEVDSGLDKQAERLRITPDPLTLDDMSKLWSSFQSAEYRLSAGYEVSVVLIDSKRSGKAPLPVLKRGEEDRGADVLPSLLPALSGLRFPSQKPAAEFGDMLTLLGEHFTIEKTIIRLQHPLLKDPFTIAPLSVQNGTEMTAQLPDETAADGKWPAGFYLLSLVTKQDDTPESKEWTSKLSMPLAPKIKITDVKLTPFATARIVDLTLECIPTIRSEQKAVLLFGDRIVPHDSLEELPATLPAEPLTRTKLKFTITNVPAKDKSYSVTVRLRIDGIDSIPVDFSGGVPKFDSKQQVTVS